MTLKMSLLTIPRFDGDQREIKKGVRDIDDKKVERSQIICICLRTVINQASHRCSSWDDKMDSIRNDGWVRLEIFRCFPSRL